MACLPAGGSCPATLYHARRRPQNEKRAGSHRRVSRAFGSATARRGVVEPAVPLHVLALLLDEGADALAEQGDVERLLEGLAVAVLRQPLGAGLVLAGQRDDEGRLVLRVAAQVLGD